MKVGELIWTIEVDTRPRWVRCRQCNGTRSDSGQRGPCPSCQGSGEIPYGVLHGAFFPDTDEKPGWQRIFDVPSEDFEGHPPNFYDPPRCIGCGKYLSRKSNWNQCADCDTREPEEKW